MGSLASVEPTRPRHEQVAQVANREYASPYTEGLTGATPLEARASRAGCLIATVNGNWTDQTRTQISLQGRKTETCKLTVYLLQVDTRSDCGEGWATKASKQASNVGGV